MAEYECSFSEDILIVSDAGLRRRAADGRGVARASGVEP
jgi:hypothetical protein